MSAEIIVCCGSGGVGKTTVSAALALKLALSGRRVAVLTVDPARRLADSLSVGELGNTARTVPLDGLEPAPGGELDAMMLDAEATFRELVQRYASSPDLAERILSNRYYRFASGRLGGTHEYMAMEKLLQLADEGPYDVIVLDTPPTRHALDFLRAPDRMARLMDQGVLRWLVMPATSSGWRALELGSEAVARVLKRVIGRSTVQEIAEFFEVFRDLWDGFRERSLQVNRLLRGPRTRFVLVTTPAPAARSEAFFFLDLLFERNLPFGGFVVNRVVSAPLHELDRERLPAHGPLPDDRWQVVCDEVARAPELRRRLAADHARSIEHLRSAAAPGTPCWTVPEHDRDLHDLAALASLGPDLP